MKLVADQNLLAAWLRRAASFANPKSLAPVFTCVLLDASDTSLTFSATNASFNITGALELVDAEPGSVSTPAGRLAQVVTTLRPGQVELSYEPPNGKLKIKSGRTNVALPALDPLTMPVFMRSIPPAQVAITAGEFDRALNFVAPAMSDDYDRAAFWGVTLSFEQHDDGWRGYAAACDGKFGAVHRLDATIDNTISDLRSPAIILPRPLCEKLHPLLKEIGAEAVLKIAIDSRVALIKSPEWSITAKLIDGTSPPFKSWLPGSVARPVTINSAELTAILTRLSAAIDFDNTRLKERGASFGFVDQALSVRSSDRSFEDWMTVTYDGDDQSNLGFNTANLTEAMAAIGAQEVELHAIDRDTPARLCAAGDADSAFVITPYRI